MKVPFTPQGMYLLIQIPEGAIKRETATGVVLLDSTIVANRKEYIEKGDKMEVKAVGEGCVFAEVGDLVSVSIRGSLELNIDDIDEPFVVIRESEILGKYTD